MSIEEATDVCEAEIEKTKARRNFLALSDGSYMLCGASWRMELDHVHRQHGELIGELAVIVPARDGLPEFRNTGTFNISAVRTRKERAKYLSDLASTFDFDFLPLIEELCERVLAAERAGQPAIILRDVPRPTAASIITVGGFTMAREHATIPFGDGGTGKSMFALWLSVQLEALGLRVLYADWELSEDEHRLRLEQLCGSAMPGIRYVRCDRPLTAEVDRLARLVRDNQIDYQIIDSIAPACDGAPEAAEAATGFFRALRQLKVGALCVAHTNRSETADKKPFGSAFWHNLARMTWFVERAEDCGDTSRTTITLHNRKNNIGPPQSSVGFEFHFAGDRTHVHPVDVGMVADLTAKAPTWQRMIGALRGGPMTLAALAQDLDVKVETLKKTVDRSKGRVFARVTNQPDGITRIALVDRRQP